MTYNYIKSILGKMIAIIGIILFFIVFWWWLFPILLIVTKGKPVFAQTRVGRLGQPFKLYKFRTLPPISEEYVAQYNYHGKEYILGHFLRRYSLDETLQLINILKGEMCFIGPRPVIAQEKELIALRKEKGIQYLKPGLTGYAQLQYYNEADVKQKVEYDYYYLQHFGFKQDFLIFLKSFAHIAQRT